MKISEGFAEVGKLMSSDFEPVVIKRSVSHDEITPSESPVPAASAQPAAKKAKKEKDPNAPKRPLNAYFLFQRDQRAHLKSTQPDLPYAESNKLMNEAWEKMSSEERAKYENEAKVLLEAYNKEFKAYKEGTLAEPIKTEAVKAETAKAEISESPSSQSLDVPVASQSSSTETPKKKKKKQKHREGNESESPSKSSQ